jgi:hypothetical protein
MSKPDTDLAEYFSEIVARLEEVKNDLARRGAMPELSSAGTTYSLSVGDRAITFRLYRSALVVESTGEPEDTIVFDAEQNCWTTRRAPREPINVVNHAGIVVNRFVRGLKLSWRTHHTRATA